MKRSKAGARLVAFALPCGLMLAGACTKDPKIATRAITMHVPASCPLATGDRAYGLFLASGDFDPAANDGHRLADIGRVIAIPDATRALVVDVSDGDLEWRGLRDVAASGDVDVLLWPFQSACALTGPSEAGVEKRTGSALGVLDASRVLLVGGTGDGNIPDTFVADLSTGIITQLAAGLLVARTRGTVTRFGDGGLVAGGARGDGTFIDNAEVFVAGLHGGGGALGDFDRSPILLSGARADHGAAVLVTGETLLVGGRSTATGGPLATLEIVDPKTKSSRTQGLAQLAVPRTNAVVLRLASGEVLVAGGFDAQNKPVSTLEWLTPDARGSARHARDLVARKERGFVALPGGGALAVIAPDAGDVGLQTTWVISADGQPEPALPITGALTQVRLFAGAEGKPLLWTGDRWLAWSPWSGTFVAFGALGTTGRGPPTEVVASPDPGLAMWLDGAALVGLRFATPSAYATFPSPLLVADTAQLAPDRLVLPGVTTSVRFDPQLGLVLAPGASVFVGDATYASVAIDVDVPTGEPPLVVLRDELGTETAIGGDACPAGVTSGAPATLHIERDGPTVRVGGHPCGATIRTDARVSIGLRGAVGADRSVARNVRILRR